MAMSVPICQPALRRPVGNHSMHKRPDIELLRIISIFAIIWYHAVTEGREVSYAGLIVFLILSAYLAGKNNSSDNHRIVRRAERLLIPWAVWFIIYGAVNVVAHKSIVPLNNGFIAGVLAGPSIHLWYVPFLFVCLTLFDFVRHYASGPSIAWSSATLAIITLGSTAVWLLGSIQLGYPIVQYAHAAAGIFLGAFFSYLDRLPRHIGAVLLLVIIVASVSAIPYEGVGIPYLIGIAAGCIVAFQIFKNASSMNLSDISQCTFGIYFVHILFLKFVKKINTVPEIVVPIIVFFLSIVTVFFMRRSFPKAAKYWS